MREYISVVLSYSFVVIVIGASGHYYERFPGNGTGVERERWEGEISKG